MERLRALMTRKNAGRGLASVVVAAQEAQKEASAGPPREKLRKMAKLLRCVGGLCALSLAVAACGAAAPTKATAPSTSRVAFDYGVFQEVAVTIGGLKLGNFSNLPHMTPVTEASGGAAIPLIASGTLAGQADIAPLPLVLALARDVPLDVVWLTGSLPTSMVVAKSITSPLQVEGKKIGIVSGTIDEFVMESYLAAHGVNLAKVDFVNLPGGALVAAFKTGEIVGAAQGPPTSTDIIAAGGHAFYTTQIPVFDVFSQAFVRSHPGTVQRFVCDAAQANGGLLKDPARYWAAIGAAMNLSTAEVGQLLPVRDVAPEDQARVRAWEMSSPSLLNVAVATGVGMAKAGLVPSAPSRRAVAAAFDPKFADAVAAGKCGS